MKKTLFVLSLVCTLMSTQAQVGIGTTTPDNSSILDVVALDKGILVPRVNLLNVANLTIPINAPTTSLLVWNTNAGVIGGNGIGYYYFDGSQWMSILQNQTDDTDWYEEGTTTAPDDINDDKFTFGNIAIGKNTADWRLEVEEPNGGRGVSILMNGTANVTTYGLLSEVTNTGDATHVGLFGRVLNNGNGEHRGLHTRLNGIGTGDHYGAFMELEGSGNGAQYGLRNNISNGGSGDHYGVYNFLSGGNISNIKYGVFNDLSSARGAEIYGLYNQINNNLAAQKTGIRNIVTSTNGGLIRGIDNSVSLSGGTLYGISNIISGSGAGARYGIYNVMDGSAFGNQYGIYNMMNPANPGPHYGIYSEALRSTGTTFAGYFLGNVSIGTTTANNYILPPSRGAANQIMQTDGTGNVSWTNTSSLNVDHSINDLLDGKSDSDGTQDGSSIFLGVGAGINDDSSNNLNVGIGFNAMNSSTTGNGNVAIGYRSLYSNTTGFSNVALGFHSLYNNLTGAQNVALGLESLRSNTMGSSNIALGFQSAYSNIDGIYNIAIGDNSLNNNTSGDQNVAIGRRTLFNNASGSSNVALGFSAGYNETGSNKLYIENSNSSTPLIYGEFDTDLLRINGTLDINNAYQFPTADGAANQVMQTDGAGNVIWTDTSSLNVDHSINDLLDGKSDVAGTSIFLGVNAGSGDNLTNNRNIGIGFNALTTNVNATDNTSIGYNALQNAIGNGNVATGNNSLLNSTTGQYNTAIAIDALRSNIDGNYNTGMGSAALYDNTSGTGNIAVGTATAGDNTTGNYNTAVGYQALRTNSTGNNNVALGFQAGYNETGSNRLYIDNSLTSSPLIYGEFDTNLLRVNGTLDINNAYQFPNADGTANQIMQTDGAGNVNWVNPAAVGDNLGNHNAQTALDMNTYNIFDVSTVITTAADSYDKLRVYSSPNYTIGMHSSMTYGFLNDWAMTFTMNNDFDRGWIWRDVADAQNDGAMSLTTDGRMTVKQYLDIPSTADATGVVNSGGLQIGGSLRLDGNEVITNNNTILYIQNGNNGDLRVDANTLAVDASLNRVGIGTIVPAYQLQLTTNSAAKPTSNAWTVASDERLKTNISSFTDGLELIKKINPIWFTYNGKGGMPNETGVGTLAQDFQKLAPYMVKPWQYTSEDGATSESYLGIDYGPLLFVTVNAIQEQQDIIEAQNQKIETLEQKLEQQQKEIDDIKSLLKKQ